MLSLKTGDFCIKIFSVNGSELACLARVKKASATEIRMHGDKVLRYDPKTGKELGGVIPGCISRLVEIDGGQAELANWAYRLVER